MSNVEKNDIVNNLKNTDKDLKEDSKKEEENLKEGNKNSQLQNSELKKTLCSSLQTLQSSTKEDNSNINTQETNSSIQYILSDQLSQSKIISQNEQNCTNSINLLNSQNQNENINKNLFINNNQLNLVNLENLIQELNKINMNSEKKNDFSPYNNLKKDNLLNNNNYSNKANFIPQKKEAVTCPPFNAQQALNLQNTFTKKAILSSFLSQKTTLILQNMINEAPKELIEKIVNELSGTYASIIKNKNGNYFCSDLFKICEQKQRIIVLKELSKTFSDDCNDKFATHPLQILVEYSACEEEYNLILFSFYDYNKSLIACLDPNGSFVIQKIIRHIPEKYKMRFNLLFIRFITFIVKKKFGVINAKKFVDYTKNEEILNQVIHLIIADFINIATDQFGNFFIQHILEKWCNTNVGNKIKKEIINNFRLLFNNKYSSFICDLFLKLANNSDKKQLIASLNLNVINNSNNINNNIDKIIMMKIIKSFEQNFGNNRNNNINNNNFNNQNQIPLSQNNYYNNNNNSNNFLNQLPLSLNNFGKRK